MAMWSNNVQYDEVISNFFSLLIPKQLHDRDGIIDSFLDAVAIWTIADTRWPIDTHTTTYVVTIVKQRIKGDRKCQSPLLFQKIFNALDARFEHVCFHDRDQKAMSFPNDTVYSWIRQDWML